MKMAERASMEASIAAFLTKEPGAEKYRLPLLEVIPMHDRPEYGFLVMPRMHQCDNTPFFAVVRESWQNGACFSINQIS